MFLHKEPKQLTQAHKPFLQNEDKTKLKKHLILPQTRVTKDGYIFTLETTERKIVLYRDSAIEVSLEWTQFIRVQCTEQKEEEHNKTLLFQSPTE